MGGEKGLLRRVFCLLPVAKEETADPVHHAPVLFEELRDTRGGRLGREAAARVVSRIDGQR